MSANMPRSILLHFIRAIQNKTKRPVNASWLLDQVHYMQRDNPGLRIYTLITNDEGEVNHEGWHNRDYWKDLEAMEYDGRINIIPIYDITHIKITLTGSLVVDTTVLPDILQELLDAIVERLGPPHFDDDEIVRRLSM